MSELVDYDLAWEDWDDMVRYSPAPFHRRRLIMKLAKDLSFRSVLDVGCGNGELMDLLGQHPGVRRLVGVDLSKQVLLQNRNRFPDFAFQQLDISTETLSEQFDLVICSEVIEHVEDWKEGLRNLRAMCKEFLILTVPSGKVFPIDRKVGHYRHYSREMMEAALREVGFEPEGTWLWGFPFHTLYKYFINLSPETSMNRFAGGSYSATDKAVATLITKLFYLNLSRGGRQLITRAKAV